MPVPSPSPRPSVNSATGRRLRGDGLLFGLSRLGPGHERRDPRFLGRHLGRYAGGLDLGIRCGLVDDPLKSRNFLLEQRDLILRYPRRLGEGRLGRCQGGVGRCPIRR